MPAAPAVRVESERFLRGHPADEELTARLLASLEGRSRLWVPLFALTGAGTLFFVALMGYTFAVGIGVWGNNVPVAWAFAIINFVWWIGIGHAGTFISAFLLLLQQPWRNSVNRVAEAMTLFAVANAGLFPLLHLGRAWFFYYLIPYPSTLDVWPQFRSALPWDFAAIATYGTVSLLFWYTGLVPDLATVRDRAAGIWRRRVYGVFALGWNGSARAWHQHRVAYGLMAALATPLVILVHSVVSTDFAMTHLPGWHTTIFPPYFVVGALYSGFAMVLTLVIPVRRLFGWQDVITAGHLDSIAKITLVMGWLMIFSYGVEFFSAWYSGSGFERFVYLDFRPLGSFAAAFWLMMLCNCGTPQLLWVPAVRRSPLALFAISLAIQVGMWTERYVIVVTSLARDFLPSSWREYGATWVDWGLLAGSISFFAFLFLLFLRFVPPIPIAKVKELRDDLAEEDG